MNLKTLRKEVDKIDQQILLLLERRLSVARKIGKAKKKLHLGITSKARETQVIDSWLLQGNQLELRPKFVTKIIKLIIAEAKQAQKI